MQTMGGPQFSSFITAVPSDTAEQNCRAIYVGGAGDITVKQKGAAASAVFKAVPVGTVLYISLDQGLLMATGTTATLMILLS